MLMFEALVDFPHRKSILSMVYSALAILLLIPLTGCADGSASGLDSNHASHSAADIGEDQDPTITMTSTPSGITANVIWDHPPNLDVARYTLYYRKHSQDSNSAEPTSEGFTSEQSPSEEPRSCSQVETNVVVEAPAATIMGLQPDTAYFFMIRASTKDEAEILCSNEIMAVTPPLKLDE